jgi:hypothetical protein
LRRIKMADKEVRLIDADALKVILNKVEEESERDWFKGNEFREMIDIMPTIEAEPVKHGKWIEKKVCRMKWIPYADDDVNPDDVDIECMTEQKCSYCKRWTIKFTYHIELDYCPLCGARMGGDGND